MRIERYPRPRNDTGIGFHYSTGTPRYDREAARFWASQLNDLGASWLVLPCHFPTPIPDQFLAEIIACDVEPIVGLLPKYVAPLDESALRAMLKRYATLGVRYLYLYREPNNVHAWEPSEWARPGLVERFMDILAPGLDRVLEADLYPVFTPLCPGGHYWDTTFLDHALDWLQQRGKHKLLDRLSIGMQNFASNRPLNWGQGARRRWPSARPYHCPPGCQDHRGFRLFEWYDEVVRSRIGRSLPLIAVENGLVVGTRNHPGFPAIDEQAHAQQIIEMTRQVMNSQVPDYVLNNAFWSLEAGSDEAFEGHAWYRRDGSQLQAVTALKTLPKHARPQPGHRYLVPSASDRVIEQYLLLPTSSRASQAPLLDRLVPLIAEHQLTVGFRLEEARQARSVILLGGPDEIPPSVEAELRKAGCHTTRVHPGDSPIGTERRLAEALGRQRVVAGL